MEREFEIIQFINDLFVYAEELKKKHKYELEHFSIIGGFKFYHPGAILGAISIDKQLRDYDNVNKDSYYLFYDLLRQKFVYLKGSQISSSCCILSNRFRIKNIANKIKDWSDIIDNLENIRRTIGKEIISNLTKRLADNNDCSSLNNTTKPNSSSNMLLLDVTSEFEDEDNIEHYNNDQLYTILSLYIFLEFDYEISCFDGKFLKEKIIREFIKFIKKRFTKYEYLNNSICFSIYPTFIANADGRQCCASIYIDFEIDDPFEILSTIELLDMLDKF